MSNKLTDPTRVIIPVGVAIAKTANWRKFISNAFPEDSPQSLAKGVYISRQDIIDLAQFCNEDETLLGVRAYFTLEGDPVEMPKKNPVKFLMVLVQDSPDHPMGKDLLYTPDGMESVLPELQEKILDNSNVYDFTRPCPDCCDRTSPLYSNRKMQDI